MTNVSAMTMLSRALDSLNQELERAGTRKDLCELLLLHGDMVVIDYADCGGMGYVRLVTANPTEQFPTPAPAASCASSMAYSMEVGIVRTAPGMGRSGGKPTTPTADEQGAATSLALEDMEVMLRALKVIESEVYEFTLGSYTPMGPAGGGLGGFWSFTVGDELDD